MKIEPVKNKKGAYLEYYYYSDSGTCTSGANDYIEILITIFTYFFVKMNCRSILADGKIRCFSGQLAVLKMSLILFLARGSSATN